MTKRKKLRRYSENKLLSRFLKTMILKMQRTYRMHGNRFSALSLKLYGKGKCKIASVMKRMSIQKIQQTPVMDIPKRR